MTTPTMAKPAFRPAYLTKNTKPAVSRKKATPNGSILSFFKKVAAPEESMFVDGSSDAIAGQHAGVDVTSTVDCEDETTGSVFSEGHTPTKRRRLDEKQQPSSRDIAQPQTLPKSAGHIQRGPFVDDSDEDEEDGVTLLDWDVKELVDKVSLDGNDHEVLAAPIDQPETLHPQDGASCFGSFDALLEPNKSAPRLKQEDEGSNNNDIFIEPDFDENDFDFDDAFEGEEYRERRYMELQEKLESEAAWDEIPEQDQKSSSRDDGAMVQCCPICGTSLAKNTADEATVHVNACLDGSAAPSDRQNSSSNTTEQNEKASCAQTLTQSSISLSKRFLRVNTPRPGQPNPVTIGLSTPDTPAANSAFARMMSSHAENSAWATAAASEHASRGKHHYERTCPFYKIMPGTFICVDAFRYGAVEGCRAYFLSHFHSDHYVGLTAKWNHGPIYCSRVTGSLVKSRLGTAEKWVVELDFEETVEVPGTEGVKVTMIPANHCPGSSMFLFEKALSGNRTQRILHCGDFRACPAHVRHPLLRPGTVDLVTGKTKQQKIDVCYLDTTYLNPRYSFPPQNDVITACADLCASLDHSLKSDEEKVWERVLGRHSNGGKGRNKGGDGNGSVSKFFVKEPESKAVQDASGSTGPASSAMPPSAISALGRPPQNRKRLLVICGTYSIGKERICKVIAQALGTKIFAPPAKIRVISQLGDPELTALMTSNATEAQVHMQMLMEIRAETLAEYLDSYRPHFSHIVGFRPSGWNYRPSMASNSGRDGAGSFGRGASAIVTPSANLVPSTLPTPHLLHGSGWRTRFRVPDLVPQRGSTREAMCFGVPYSEHSSFRELALFIMALRIEKVVPTVNVGSEQSRKRMKSWIDRWMTERRKGGVVDVRLDEEDQKLEGNIAMWEGKDGTGGSAYW